LWRGGSLNPNWSLENISYKALISICIRYVYNLAKILTTDLG
jgi:hypothetical protein